MSWFKALLCLLPLVPSTKEARFGTSIGVIRDSFLRCIFAFAFALMDVKKGLEHLGQEDFVLLQIEPGVFGSLTTIEENEALHRVWGSYVETSMLRAGMIFNMLFSRA